MNTSMKKMIQGLLVLFAFIIIPSFAHADSYDKKKDGSKSFTIGSVTYTVSASLYCNDNCNTHINNFSSYLKKLTNDLIKRNTTSGSFSKWRISGDCNNSYFTGKISMKCTASKVCHAVGDGWEVINLSAACKTTKTACDAGFSCSKGVCVPPNTSTTIIDGQCSGSHFSCLKGSSENALTGSDGWSWVCKGINGGKDSGMCSESCGAGNKIQSGRCVGEGTTGGGDGTGDGAGSTGGSGDELGSGSIPSNGSPFGLMIRKVNSQVWSYAVSIPKNADVVIGWITNGYNTCTGSGAADVQGWNGPRGTSTATTTISNLLKSTAFTLSCEKNGVATSSTVKAVITNFSEF